MGPIANLSSPLHQFLNPSRIQIQTQFFCGSQFITVAGPTLFFSSVFSLSSTASLPLSLSSRPLHRRRQTKKYPTKQKQTEMQKIILSVLFDKKKSEEGKEEELWGLSKKKKKRKKKWEKWGGRKSELSLSNFTLFGSLYSHTHTPFHFSMASTPSGQPDRTKPTTTRKVRVVAKTCCFTDSDSSTTPWISVNKPNGEASESVRASQFRSETNQEVSEF